MGEGLSKGSEIRKFTKSLCRHIYSPDSCWNLESRHEDLCDEFKEVMGFEYYFVTGREHRMIFDTGIYRLR